MSKKNMVLKICTIPWVNASRDKRELGVCRKLGAEVLVMAKGNPENKGKKVIVSGFDVLLYGTRPLGKRIPNFINRVVSVIIWAHHARKLNPQIISGHDLTGLLVGWMSTVFVSKSKKPKLVYDSHELEIGRNAKRNNLQIWLIKQLERFLISKCVFSIMVNDSIANEVQSMYSLSERPIVVRNIPEKWLINIKEVQQQKNLYRKSLQLQGDTFFLMYHGAVMHNRGIENIMRAFSKTERTALIIFGDGMPDYIQQLHLLAKELGIEHRTLFHPAVPINVLYKYVGAADVGMVTIPGFYRNDYLVLPNKFFENIQSLTPVIASDFPEIGSLTLRYGIGLTVNPDDVDGIAEAIEKMRDDQNLYKSCKENLVIAKNELCWEIEQEVLIEAYGKIIVSDA